MVLYMLLVQIKKLKWMGEGGGLNVHIMCFGNHLFTGENSCTGERCTDDLRSFKSNCCDSPNGAQTSTCAQAGKHDTAYLNNVFLLTHS